MMQSKTKAILVGLILGDGYLTKPSGNSTRSKLDIKYDEKSLEYLTWIHRQLEELHPSEIKKKKGFHQYRFYTKTSYDIGKLRQIFYKNGIKRIPEDIGRYLRDPLTLAVWYQDDGTLDFRSKYHCNSKFATYCFSYNECKLLANALRVNFGLDVRVCKSQMRGKMRFCLYMTSKSMDIFMHIIEPYMQRCFYYKLVKYRNNTLASSSGNTETPSVTRIYWA